MHRSDDKIKGILFYKCPVIISKIRTKAKFYTDLDIDLVFIFLRQRRKYTEIFFRIKNAFFSPFHFIFIIVVCKTDCPKPLLNSSPYHFFRSRLGIMRKCRMHVYVSYYSICLHVYLSPIIVPPPRTYSPSYKTTACPGVIALTGSSKVQSISSSPVLSTVHHAPL